MRYCTKKAMAQQEKGDPFPPSVRPGVDAWESLMLSYEAIQPKLPLLQRWLIEMFEIKHGVGEKFQEKFRNSKFQGWSVWMKNQCPNWYCQSTLHLLFPGFCHHSGVSVPKQGGKYVEAFCSWLPEQSDVNPEVIDATELSGEIIEFTTKLCRFWRICDKAGMRLQQTPITEWDQLRPLAETIAEIEDNTYRRKRRMPNPDPAETWFKPAPGYTEDRPQTTFWWEVLRLPDVQTHLYRELICTVLPDSSLSRSPLYRIVCTLESVHSRILL